MNRTFKNVAFFFFLGFGLVYLTADFLINQGRSESAYLKLVYQTFDMPFFFSAGMYVLSSIFLAIQKRFFIRGLSVFFWVLSALWIMVLLYLNLGFQSWL